MKNATAGMIAHLGLDTTTLATCWKIKRSDGRIFGFTDHDLDLDVDLSDGDGTITYQAASGYRRSEITTSGAFDVDDLEVIGVLDSDTITVADIRAGRYDEAEVKIFLVNWADLSDGTIALRRGHIGNVTRREETFVAELNGLTQKLSQEIVGLVSPGCRADLGDDATVSPSIHGCKVRLDPPTWAATTAYTVREDQDAGTGSVVKPTSFNDRHFKCVVAGTSGGSEPPWNTTIGAQTTDGSVVWETIQALTIETTVAGLIDSRNFEIAYTGSAAAARFVGGLCTFLDQGSPSPGNAGLVREIRAVGGSPLGVTVGPEGMPFTINVGDPVTMSFGCDKADTTCSGVFDNIFNFRGENHVPGTDAVFETPNAR